MKKSLLTVIIIAVVIVLAVALVIVKSPEDDWIKDDRGVWIKHGAPAGTPNDVKEQQQVIEVALDLYNQKKAEGMQFSSQCLGVVGDNEKYAIDIVHVTRNDIDNLAENQCQEYREGKVTHFVELDGNGNVVRIQ